MRKDNILNSILKYSCIMAYCLRKEEIRFDPVVTSSIVHDAKSVDLAKICLPKGITYGLLTETGSWLLPCHLHTHLIL